MIVLQNPVLAAGSFTHSTVRHPFRSASYTSLLPHFFISFIPPASAPRSKSPAFATLHKSRLIPFRVLVIYLFISIWFYISFQVKCTTIIHFNAYPANSSTPSIPSVIFVPFRKVIAFPFPHHAISQKLYFPCRIIHPKTRFRQIPRHPFSGAG